jgi:hypothetical protein
VSVLERLRKGPTGQTGKEMGAALERVANVAGLGLGSRDLSGVPHRKVADLARYGMAATLTQLSRHPVRRRLATLLATVVYLEGRAVDDALELLDVLMAAKLIGPVQRAVDKQTLRRWGAGKERVTSRKRANGAGHRRVVGGSSFRAWCGS